MNSHFYRTSDSFVGVKKLTQMIGALNYYTSYSVEFYILNARDRIRAWVSEVKIIMLFFFRYIIP
jgi:hypothetical protein